MLAGDPGVEAVAFGQDNILSILDKRAIHISSSTIGVDLSERLAREHAKAGQAYLSAPVLGRSNRDIEGQLFIVAAGDGNALERIQSLFDAIGLRTIVVGHAPVNANLAKLGINFLIATVFEALGEAIALVDRSGPTSTNFSSF